MSSNNWYERNYEAIPPDISDTKVEYLKAQIEKQKLELDRERNHISDARVKIVTTALTIFATIAVAFIAFGSDFLGLRADANSRQQQAQDELRLELAKFIIGAETFAGIQERIQLLQYFFKDDFITVNYDPTEYAQLANELIKLREQVPEGGPLFSGNNPATCHVMDPTGFAASQDALNAFLVGGDPWGQIASALQQRFAPEIPPLDAFSAAYAIVCSGE